MLKSLIIATGISLALNAGAMAAPRLSVENISKTVPVLTLKDNSPVLHFRVINNDGKPYSIKDLVFSLQGTTVPEQVTSASLFFGSKLPAYGEAFPDSLVSTAIPKKGILKFKVTKPVSADTLDCWVALSLKDDAMDKNARISLSCTKFSTTYGSPDVAGLSMKSLRVGAAVRKSGQDGINTSRIPGLITTTKGTLIALYDARNERDDDLQGDIDIAINRSEDGGKTWGPVIKAIDMGEYGGLPERYNGVSDGSVLVDPKTGKLFATGLWMHGVNDPKTGEWVTNLNDTSTVWNHQWRAHGTKPGYDIKGSAQFMMVTSTDDGKTWSKPVNITKQVKKPEYCLMAPGPGRGIVMQDGTLVFPAEGRDAKGAAFSTIIYSKDNGETWIAGEPATFNTNECQVVELSDHSLMLNARHRANRRLKKGNGRAIAVTKDLGKTWTEHSTSRNALIEPACQGGFLRHEYTRNGEKKHILIFSNPSDTDSRINHTLKVSFDDGQTWPEKYWILLDEGKGAGYSCLTSIDDETIGIFYEGSQADIQFQAISLSDLLKEK